MTQGKRAFAIEIYFGETLLRAISEKEKWKARHFLHNCCGTSPELETSASVARGVKKLFANLRGKTTQTATMDTNIQVPALNSKELEFKPPQSKCCMASQDESYLPPQPRKAFVFGQQAASSTDSSSLSEIFGAGAKFSSLFKVPCRAMKREKQTHVCCLFPALHSHVEVTTTVQTWCLLSCKGVVVKSSKGTLYETDLLSRTMGYV